MPREIADRYLPLPSDFPRSVNAWRHRRRGSTAPVRARDVHRRRAQRPGPGPYKRARALQDFLRNNFTYDLRVPPGHDEPASSDSCSRQAGLLRAVRRRLRGDGPRRRPPARVAVGFTPEGRSRPPTRIGCAARTPTRGPRCTSAVRLGGFRADARHSEGTRRTRARTGPGREIDNQTAPAPVPDPVTSSTTSSSTTTTTTPPPQQKQSAFPWRRVLVIGLLLLALGGLVGAVPAAHALRRQRRRSAAVTPAAARPAGLDRSHRTPGDRRPSKHRWETAAEYARRVSRATPAERRPAGAPRRRGQRGDVRGRRALKRRRPPRRAGCGRGRHQRPAPRQRSASACAGRSTRGRC